MNFRLEGDAQRAFGTRRFKVAAFQSQLDDFDGDGGGFAGDFLHAGARDFTFIHQRAGHAHELNLV